MEDKISSLYSQLKNTICHLEFECKKYCDMTPKSWNSGVGARHPLPGNGMVNTA
jgi:hypothetical protein